MKISVPVNHNFYEEDSILESSLAERFNVNGSDKRELHNLFSSVHELKIGAEQLKKIKTLKFKKKAFEPNEDRLILKFYSKEIPDKEKQYFIQTGLYAGVVFYKGCRINITPKYGDTFLKRMLNFVNDIYVDNEKIDAIRINNENQFLFVIAYLFIQSLEKASILGLPQQYVKMQERGHKVKGSIDFNEYLKKDIPFQGKLTSNFRQQMYVQEIVDVLYLALKKLEAIFGKEIHSCLLGLNQLLRQYYSGHYASYETIHKAKTHQAINNPIYSGFKKVLEYAEIILLDQDIIPVDNKKQLETSGYVFDISELFELYLEKLLRMGFPDWSISGQEELPIYKNQFYGRSIYPDLVMKHRETGKIIVLDAKFKNMSLSNSDVDRNDLHQIHSYSGYFHKNLVASGLIYPLSKNINLNKAHSCSLYGNCENEIKFIIDGIYVDDLISMENLINNENEFISRVHNLINQ